MAPERRKERCTRNGWGEPDEKEAGSHRLPVAAVSAQVKRGSHHAFLASVAGRCRCRLPGCCVWRLCERHVGAFAGRVVTGKAWTAEIERVCGTHGDGGRLPAHSAPRAALRLCGGSGIVRGCYGCRPRRSEEHTSELQSRPHLV